MSKRLIRSEWSDEEFDGIESEALEVFKRRKFSHRFDCINNNNNNSSESVESSPKSRQNIFKNIFSTVSNGFTNIMNNSYKIFKTKSEDNNCQSVRNESLLGMNSINNMSYITNCQQNSSYSMPTTNCSQITVIPVNAVNNSLVLVNSPFYQIIPTQTVINNITTTPNSLVFNQNQINHNTDLFKCQLCGQMYSSPGKKDCGHCGRKSIKMTNNPNKIRLTGISAESFYTSTPKQRPIKKLVPTKKSFNQKIQSLSHQIPRQECIVIDDSDDRRHAFNQNQRYIEITESHVSDHNYHDIGNQCDLNSDPNIHPISIEPIDGINSQNTASEQQTNDGNESNPISSPVSPKLEPLIIHKKAPIFHATSFPQFVMFGTYRTDAKTAEFDTDGIKLTNVSPNNPNTKFKYHIMIPFIEMKELLYCCETNLNVVFIKPTKESNDKIRDCMYLGNESKNGLKFDVNSMDMREQNIIFVLKEILSPKFIGQLESIAKNCNPELSFSKINIDKAKYLLNRIQSRIVNNGSADQRFEQTLSSQISRTSTITRNPFATNPLNSKSDSHKEQTIYSTPSKRMTPAKTRVSTPINHTVIQIDDDDDEEENTSSKSETDNEFDKVFLVYPEDEKNAIQLVGTDMLCLNKREFLNDNIVNFYLRFLIRSDKISDDIKNRTHIFDTLFFIQLTEKRPSKRKNSSGYEEYTFEQRYNKKLKKWTKDIDIFNKNFLVLPIIKESHWFLAIVCNPSYVPNKILKEEDVEDFIGPIPEPIENRACIIFMDSLGNAGYKKHLTNPIREFLSLEWKNKNEPEVQFKSKAVMRDFFPKVPNQTNSSDCGLFVLQYIEQFLKDPDNLLSEIFKNSKKALINWFKASVAKDKRQEIRETIYGLVTDEVKEKLETLENDNNDSDGDDDEEQQEDMDVDKPEELEGLKLEVNDDDKEDVTEIVDKDDAQENDETILKDEIGIEVERNDDELEVESKEGVPVYSVD